MVERRLQILPDEERHRRTADAARERGVSVVTTVREATDRGLANPGDRRRAAGARVLAAEPMPVPEVDELLHELDELRGGRSG